MEGVMEKGMGKRKWERRWGDGWVILWGRKRIEKEWHKVENPKAHWRLW